MRIDKNATSALSIVQHLYVWERTGHWHDNQSRRRGTRRGQVGRHNTDTPHIFSPKPCLAYCTCIISTWHDNTDTPIFFLQRLVMHIAHVLSQHGMIIQTPHIFSPTPCLAYCACTISTWHDNTDIPHIFSPTPCHAHSYVVQMCYFGPSIPIPCCGYNNFEIISWAIVPNDSNVIIYLARIKRAMQDLSRSYWEFETGQTKQY